MSTEIIAAPSELERRPGPAAGLWRTLRETDVLHHGNFVVGGLMVLVVLLCALLADLISPYDPLVTSPATSLQAPSAAHLLGSDEFGRDVLSRVIHGARIKRDGGHAMVYRRHGLQGTPHLQTSIAQSLKSLR